MVTASPEQAIVTLLADGHPIFRSGMRFLLQELDCRLELIEASDAAESLHLLETRRYDLVLTSLFRHDPEHEAFLSRILAISDTCRVVIVSGGDDPCLIRTVIAAGAAGYVPKDNLPQVTLQALRLVLSGGVYVPPAALKTASPHAARSMGGEAPADAPVLTARQQSVLDLLARGASNKQIARELALSPGTVKAQVARLLRIFHASNRTELVIAAAKHISIDSRGSQSSPDGAGGDSGLSN